MAVLCFLGWKNLLRHQKDLLNSNFERLYVYSLGLLLCVFNFFSCRKLEYDLELYLSDLTVLLQSQVFGIVDTVRCLSIFLSDKAQKLSGMFEVVI